MILLCDGINRLILYMHQLNVNIFMIQIQGLPGH